MPDAAPTSPQKSILRRFLFSKPLIVLLGLLVVYTLAGFFLAPLIIESQLKRYVQQDLGRRLAINRVRVNPFSLRVALKGATLSEADGSQLFAFDRFMADVELRSLADWAWVFSEVRLERPEFHLRIAPDGTFNVARLVSDATGGEPTGTPPPRPEPVSRVRLDFRHLVVRSGTFVFTDRSQALPAEATVTPIDLDIKNLTTLAGNDGRQAVRASLPHGGRLKWNGRISLIPLSSDGELTLRNFNEGILWQFLRSRLGIERPGGTVELDMHYRVAYDEGGFQMALDRISMRIAGLALALKDQPADPLMTMDEVRLSGGRFDLEKHELVVDKALFSQGRVQMVSDSLGTVNWQRIVAPDNENASADKDAQTFPFAIRIKQAVVEDVALSIRDHSWRDPLEVAVKGVKATLSARLRQPARGPFETRLDDIEMVFSDMVVGAVGADPMLRLPRAVVHRGALDDSHYRLSAAEVILSGGSTRVVLEKSGELNWQRLFTPVNAAAAKAVSERIEQIVSQDWSVQVAALRFEDFDVDLADQYMAEAQSGLRKVDIDIRDFDTDPDSRFQARIAFEVQSGGRGDITASVAPFKPAIEAAIDIRSVALAPLQPYLDTVARLKLASGTLSVKGTLGYGPGGHGGLSWRGMVQLADLNMHLPDSGKKLVALKKMVASQVEFDGTPGRLAIKSIRLVEPFLKLIIRKDMSVNLSDVLVDRSTVSRDSAPAKPLAVSIAHVRLEKATMDFADHSLPLPFEVFIENLTGGIAGVSTAAGARAAVELDGRIRPYGGVKIKGMLLPGNPAEFAEIVMAFRNLDMPELTPYAAKFAGREITSGKLRLDLAYRIEKSRLKGDNRIVLDDFTLGKHVESPSAVNLPLDLAVALLKDSRGRIDFGLQVSGDVSDPQFNYGHLIWKALLSLIQKIVTAPFQALANLLGGKGEVIDSVAFEPGRVNVPPPEAEKLARLAGVLGHRPNLVLEVKGCYDPGTDGEALRETRLRQEMASRLGLSADMQQMRGPLMLNDPAVRQVLDSLAVERLTAGELAAALVDAGVTADGLDDARTKGGIQPGVVKYYQLIYHVLVGKVPLQKEALNKLASGRAAAVVAVMHARGLSPQRISVPRDVQTGKREKGMIRCGLGLDVRK